MSWAEEIGPANGEIVDKPATKVTIPGENRRWQAHPGRDAGYEVFRLKWHEPWVDCTLPHERAMVSKTRSCRNIGLTYGFFGVVAALPADTQL